jgi:hypothetical protein
MYFPDLSPYRYGGAAAVPRVVNIGWLSGDHAFTTGEVPDSFVACVRELVASPVNLYRGFHDCEFCPEPPVTVRNGIRLKEGPPGTTGNGEIRVIGQDGITYVAPALLLHYIEAHGYQPPPAFIVAVRLGRRLGEPVPY